MEKKLIFHDNFITYKFINNNSNKDFDIVYLHGFYGEMEGRKGTLLEKIVKNNKLNLIKFNYLGHGTSSGEVTDFVLSDWLNNIRSIINKLCNKKILLVGNSMGGWLAYLIALEYKERIKGIITISTAIDFLTKIIEPKIKQENFNKDIIFEIVNSDGSPSGNLITKRLLQDSKQYNLFGRKSININCPIEMIHGINDSLIPFDISIEFAKKLKNIDTKVILVKDADHRFSSMLSLNTLENYINNFIKCMNRGIGI